MRAELTEFAKRMSQHTDWLQGAALANDTFVAADCLATPIVAISYPPRQRAGEALSGNCCVWRA